MNNSKIVVLMGGPSEEHAISLKSGQGVVEALIRRGWRAEPVIIAKELSIEEASAWTKRALQEAAAEVVFIALHGAFGEDGTIQQLCEELHLAYTGSDPNASRLGMDKIGSRHRFLEAGLTVPRWCVIEGSAPRALKQVGGWSYPLVVKPSNQGSSLGVSLVREPKSLSEALAKAGAFSRHVLIEEFVAGKEVTAGIIGDRALPIVEIRAQQPFFDYTAKYTAGMTEYLVPAPLTPEATRAVQAVGMAAHRAIGCRHFSRADILLTPDGRPVLLEVNTIPGFTPTSLLPKAAACVGISYDELCEQLVSMACSETRMTPPPAAVRPRRTIRRRRMATTGGAAGGGVIADQYADQRR